MAHSKMAMITFFEAGEPVDPSYGVPGYGGGNYPSTGPVRPGRPTDPGYGVDQGGGITTLPVFPFDPTNQPDNSLPGSGGEIDNSLPSPGKKYVVKWLACYGLILVPDNTLPSTPEPK